MTPAVRKAIRDIAKAYECDTSNIRIDFQDHGPKGDTWGIRIWTMPRDKRMRSPETHVHGNSLAEARKKALAQAPFHYELPSVREARQSRELIDLMRAQKAEREQER